MTVRTVFGKAVPDHYAVSFSESGDQNCDTSCRIYDNCYAQRIERIYKGLKAKLADHFTRGPLYVARKALAELQQLRHPIRWGRLSVDGSLPHRSALDRRTWSVFSRMMRAVVQAGIDKGAKWHIPVETPGKARSYRAMFKGLGVVVRRTSQAKRFSDVLKSNDHQSWIVGLELAGRGCIGKAVTEQAIGEAYRLARIARSEGIPTIVCPAIARDGKCGSCTGCADESVKLVLYPVHA